MKTKAGKAESAESSGLKGTDLNKALDALDEKLQDPERVTDLVKKARERTATSAELDELRKSLFGGESLEAGATAALNQAAQQEDLKKALDVSSYLREYYQGTKAGLDVLAKAIASDQADNKEFRTVIGSAVLAVGRALEQQGEVLKSLQETVENYGNQPARPPKSVSAQPPKPLDKSFAGNPPEGTQPNRAQVLRGFEVLVKSGVEHVHGEKVLTAASKFETTNLISEPMLKAVMNPSQAA